MNVRYLLPCILLAAPDTGCNAMLYPVARAFGGPSEAELKAARPAFERMKSGLPTAHWVVYPALVPVGEGVQVPETAERLMEGLRKAGATHCTVGAGLPATEPTQMGANQMRFTWKRARAYSEWVKKVQPKGDLFFFTELLRAPNGVVRGMMLYVVERSGQIAFVELWNSHHFKEGISPKDGPAACEVVMAGFQGALKWDANRVFPPYGVG